MTDAVYVLTNEAMIGLVKIGYTYIIVGAGLNRFKFPASKNGGIHGGIGFRFNFYN